MITGYRDTDILVLEAIDSEKDFLSTCISSKYLLSLCDENMFKKRIMKKYPNTVDRHKGDLTYKKLYLKLIYYIDKMKKEYDFDFKSGNPISYYNLLSDRMFDFYKIREAITFGYTDLAIFLSEKKIPINPRMLQGLFLLSARTGNEVLVKYFLNMGGFEEEVYKKASREAKMGGHFKLSEYLKNMI